jgi:putative ABC transport system permease protein
LSVTPPHFLERLVTAWLGRSASTPFVIGDLREDYRAVRTRRSAMGAAAWYLVEGARVAARIRWERVPTIEPSLVSGDRMGTDLRQAVRFLRRRPAFSVAIVLTVALAIASTTVAYAVVDGVLIEPLPYGTPDRLVAVWEHNPRGDETNVVSPANFVEWREQLPSLDAMAALIEFSSTLRGDEEPERVGLVRASASYFDVVGATPLLGRFYTEEEDSPDADNVLVMAEGYWRRRFAADPAVLGSTLEIAGAQHTIVGILPDRFDFEPETSFGGIGSRDFWQPQRLSASVMRQETGRYWQVVGRLANGATLESAREEADALAVRLAESFPERQRGWGINIIPLQNDLVGDARSTILVVFGAVCFVLLVACANIANLLITRATQRGQEMAVRAALGAGRSRIVQQLLLESALLCTLGGLLGVLLAGWAVSGLAAAAPDLPRIDSVGLDFTVVAFALITTVATALVFALLPALSLTRGVLSGWLRDRSNWNRRETRRVRSALAVAQPALSLMLLVGAGLLGRSLLRRVDVGVGFELAPILTAEVRGIESTPAGQSAFFDQLVERVRAIPGVSDAAAITWAPLAGGGSRTGFWPLDRPAPGPGESSSTDVRPVHRDYHRVMGIPVIAGRSLEAGDVAGSPLVVLASETLAEQLWPGESAIGKRIAMPWGDTLVAEVVGVVADVRTGGPDVTPLPMLYWDHRQFSQFPQMTLVVRTRASDHASVVAGIREALRELNPRVPLYNVRTMESLFADAIARARFATMSLGAFALLALVLSAIGIYGVMAHATQQRIPEIGVRLALGATRGSVSGMIVREGMLLVVVAILIGTAGAAGLARFLESLVFDVSPTDPVTFAATALLLAATGLLACWLPARRASGVDPATTIRSE